MNEDVLSTARCALLSEMRRDRDAALERAAIAEAQRDELRWGNDAIRRRLAWRTEDFYKSKLMLLRLAAERDGAVARAEKAERAVADLQVVELDYQASIDELVAERDAERECAEKAAKERDSLLADRLLFEDRLERYREAKDYQTERADKAEAEAKRANGLAALWEKLAARLAGDYVSLRQRVEAACAVIATNVQEWSTAHRKADLHGAHLGAQDALDRIRAALAKSDEEESNAPE